MPNGGIRPDCVHCKHYRGMPHTEASPFCTHHAISMALMVYVFCRDYVDPSPDEKGDWLDQVLSSRQALQRQMMYVWLGGSAVPFFAVPLAPVAEYTIWTTEDIYNALEKLGDQYRDRLRRKP